jgi:hypothetical protein
MALQLGHVLTGETRRTRKPQNERLIEIVALRRIAQGHQGRTTRLRHPTT